SPAIRHADFAQAFFNGLDWLSIGADQLGRCSSIVFDKPAKQVRLSCL
ncbi:MAG: hypothetical protein HLV41_12595, partial [Sphingomonas sanguinis]|nr:hypothetical protein [Sphingomonas sanguinis]